MALWKEWGGERWKTRRRKRKWKRRSRIRRCRIAGAGGEINDSVVVGCAPQHVAVSFARRMCLPKLCLKIASKSLDGGARALTHTHRHTLVSAVIKCSSGYADGKSISTINHRPAASRPER